MNYIRCNNQIAIWFQTTFRSSDNTPSLVYTLRGIFVFLFGNDCFTDDQNYFEL